MNIYQQQILDHYKNPKNFGLPDFTPTHECKLENLSCGDEIKIMLQVKKNKIEKAQFIGEGCSISIASASMLTERISGMNLEEFKKYSIDNLLVELGIELTITRQKCAVLPLEAAKKALKFEVN